MLRVESTLVGGNLLLQCMEKLEPKIVVLPDPGLFLEGFFLHCMEELEPESARALPNGA
jgi:hypothetical protein